MIQTKSITLDTEGNCDIIDITPHIVEFIKENEIEEGLVNVAVKGSTAGVSAIEFEPNLVKDFKASMEAIAPEDKTYEHAKTWNDDNGHSHVRASAVGFSESVPVAGGRPVLGTWQQVVVIDFDTGARRRTFTLTGIF